MNHIAPIARPLTAQRRIPIAAIAAIALGILLIFAAGFAGSESVHNAAHDTRHVHGLPCH